MKIEIELSDPQYCTDCPCVGVASFGYEEFMCNLGYWSEGDHKRPRERKGQFIRPRKCIKEHGE